MFISATNPNHAAHVGKDYGAGPVLSIEETLQQAATAPTPDQAAQLLLLAASYLVTGEQQQDAIFAVYRWLEGTEDEIDDIQIVRNLCEATEQVVRGYRQWLHTLVLEAEQFEFAEEVAQCAAKVGDSESVA